MDYAAFDVSLIPCASRIEVHDGGVVGGDDECIWDRAKVIELMDSAYYFLTYYNTEEFNKEKFGEDHSIARKSVLQAKFSATSKSTWT